MAREQAVVKEQDIPCSRQALFDHFGLVTMGKPPFGSVGPGIHDLLGLLVDDIEFIEVPGIKKDIARLEPAVALARHAAAINNFIAVLPAIDHLPDDFGRVLQIRVHHDDGVA